MKRLLLIPICFVSLLIPVAVLASSGEGGFNSVVRSIESRYGVHATQIPFLGLISFISRKATHEGSATCTWRSLKTSTPPLTATN